MIIFGTRTKISKSSEEDVLKNSCPNCGSDLVLSDLKRWFTLYFIPVVPISTIETLYHCEKCNSSYKKEIKQMLQKSQKTHKQIQFEGKKMFAITLAACMTHMAKIDGKITQEEKKEIKKMSSKLPEFKNDIEKTIEKVSKAKNDEVVFELLRKARNVLTAKGVMILVGQVARVLLADGKIDKAEEKLMQDYLLVCGVPRNLYNTIIEEVQKRK